MEIAQLIRLALMSMWLGVLVSTCGQSLADVPIFPGLVHRWPADGDTEDAAGAADGVAQGEIAWPPGRFAQAFGLTGGSWVSLGAEAASFGRGDFTISLWCRVDAPTNTMLLSKRPACAVAARIELGLRDDGDVVCELAGVGGANRSTFITRHAGLDDGAWHHVAWRRASGIQTVLVDGIALVTPVRTPIADLTIEAPLAAGWSPCIGERGDLQPFSGAIDEIQLYSVALSDCQLGALAVGGRCPDLDGSGAVDGGDLALLLAGWGGCEDERDCVTDVNADGTTDGADVGILLGAWTG